MVDRELDVDASLLGHHHQLLRGQLRLPAVSRQRVNQPARPGQRLLGLRPVLGQLLPGGQPEQDVDLVLSDPAAHARGILLLLSLRVAAWAERLSYVSQVGCGPLVVLTGKGIEFRHERLELRVRGHPVDGRRLHRRRDALVEGIEALLQAAVMLGRRNGRHLSRPASACP